MTLISANVACGDRHGAGFNSDPLVPGIWQLLKPGMGLWFPGNMRSGQLLLATIYILFSGSVLSQQDDSLWETDFQSFALATYTGRVNNDWPQTPEGRRFLLAEERLRLELNMWTDFADTEILVKLDGVHDWVAQELSLDLREAYIDFTTGQADFRFGRQIATWGVGDLLFINDVFPKNWVSFFSGRPLEYLKVGVDALRGRYSSDILNAELLLIPRFEPDTLPTPMRFFLHDDFAHVSIRDEQLPDTGFADPESALRLYRRFGGYDISFYTYRGHWRSPGQLADDPLNPARVTHFFPALSTYGFSAQGQAMRGVISLEAGYYDSREDRAGDNAAIANSQARFLVGYQKQLSENVTLGFQYYAEIMMDFAAYETALPTEFARQNKYRDIATVSVRRFLKHHIWELALFAFYSPAERDYLIQPRAVYRVSDNFSAVLGANVFGGKRSTTFFGQFGRNDNIYLTLRYDF